MNYLRRISDLYNLLIWVRQAGYTAGRHSEEVCRFYEHGKGAQVYHLRQAC
jgi:hypothetical protein